jgi:hypothetical protein
LHHFLLRLIIQSHIHIDGGDNSTTSTNEVIEDVHDSASESSVEAIDYGDNIDDVDNSSAKSLIEVNDYGDNSSRDSRMEATPKSSTSHVSNCTDISPETSIK